MFRSRHSFSHPTLIGSKNGESPDTMPKVKPLSSLCGSTVVVVFSSWSTSSAPTVPNTANTSSSRVRIDAAVVPESLDVVMVVEEVVSCFCVSRCRVVVSLASGIVQKMMILLFFGGDDEKGVNTVSCRLLTVL